MPRKTKDGKPFDQSAYIAQWTKENMTAVTGRYKKEFVQEFKEACAFLGVKQSQVIKQAMQEVIDKAKINR